MGKGRSYRYNADRKPQEKRRGPPPPAVLVKHITKPFEYTEKAAAPAIAVSVVNAARNAKMFIQGGGKWKRARGRDRTEEYEAKERGKLDAVAARVGRSAKRTG